MTRKNRYIATVLLCAAAALFNSANFSGLLHNIEYIDFPLCLIALHVIYFSPGETLAACLMLGFLIDSASGRKLPVHIAAYLLYTAAGSRLSGVFYSQKSIPNAIAQILLISTAEAALFAARVIPMHGPRPDYKVLMKVIIANAIVVLAASAAEAISRRNHSTYKIHAAGGGQRRPG